MKVSRSPEISLLLMACKLELQPEQTKQLTDFLEQHSIDWDRVYLQADRHRLIPFLYRTLQHVDDVPDNFINKLRESYQRSAIDGMVKIQEYRSLKTLLNANDIDHIAYKGIYLAEHCYPDTSLRISGDIDVLTDEKQAISTIKLLLANQYNLNKKHRLYVDDGDGRMLNDLYEVSLFKAYFNNNFFDIDLHWNIVCFNKDFATFNLNYIRSLPNFEQEIQVLLLIAHHGVTNIWQKIYYVNDLYFLLKKKETNWEWLIPQMRNYGMERIFLAGLHWCQEIWGLYIPPNIQPLVRSAQVMQLVSEYEKNWEAEIPKEFSHLVYSQFSFFLKSQSQFAKKIKIVATFCTSRVFRASTFKVGQKLIYIPKEFGLITVLIRAIRSLTRFFVSPKAA